MVKGHYLTRTHKHHEIIQRGMLGQAGEGWRLEVKRRGVSYRDGGAETGLSA